MQPLISPVDHEVRHNSYRADDEQTTTAMAEDTPLLHRFPQPPTPNEHRSRINAIVISLLLIILVSGIVIGIYLLILQNNSENILPPVETPLRLVSRTQWDSNGKSPPVLTLSRFMAEQVIVVQTDTKPCDTLHSCVELLRNMQVNTTDKTLPYNFLVASDGQVYEALGWRRPSPLFPEYRESALVLAFIGNFTEVPPAPVQLVEANLFLEESISFQHLAESYIIIGKQTRYTPKYLFLSLRDQPRWNSELSDA